MCEAAAGLNLLAGSPCTQRDGELSGGQSQCLAHVGGKPTLSCAATGLATLRRMRSKQRIIGIEFLFRRPLGSEEVKRCISEDVKR